MSDQETLQQVDAPRGLSKAFATILSRPVTAAKSSTAVLSERSELQADLLKRKLDQKLEKQLRETRRAKRTNDGHVKVDVLQKDHEKGLRKIANKGIVQIFNAVRVFKEGQKSGGSGVQEMPMDNFMDLLRGK